MLSTGEVIPNPRHLEVAQRELRRLQRQAARRDRPGSADRQVPSARWGKTTLVRGHPTIVIEELNVAGLSRNRRLARHVAGVGMGELRRQVEYKTGWSGVRLHIAGGIPVPKPVRTAPR